MMSANPLTLILLAAALARAADAPPAPSIYSDNDLALIVKTQTLKLPRIDEVLDLLEVRPKMTVLDIGAGSGQQSYRLARKVGPSGRVYATDIDPQLVAYVGEQAKKLGLDNLEPLLVKKDGVDPAYSRHRYDLILLYDVDNYLHDRAAYYGEMRKYLEPGGRIAVVESESIPNRSFYREDFDDWRGFVARLRSEPPQSPFGRALRQPLQELLDAGGEENGRKLERHALFHLNRLLDTKFFLEFTDGLELKKGLDFTPKERAQALWMLHRLRLAGPLEKWSVVELDLHKFRLMQLLNRLLVIEKFRPFLAKGDLAPYWSPAMETRWYLHHDRRVREFQQAGLELDNKRTLDPFWALWIFKPAR